MLLRIIHKPADDRQNYSVKIEFTSGDKTKSFNTEYNAKLSSANLRNDLVWYFKGYLTSNTNSGPDRSVIDRLINHGKRLGDNLVGDDLQLACYREEIEDGGYGNLSVSIESGQIGFFEEDWETLILPNAKYMLASAASRFVRRFHNPSPANLTGDCDNTIAYQLSRESPLSVLHAVHVQEMAESDVTQTSVAYTAAAEQLRYDGVVHYRVAPLRRWQSFKNRLQSAKSVVHIFRYDGPLSYKDETVYLGNIFSADGSTQAEASACLSELAGSLQKSGCALFLLNATEWHCEASQSITADIGMALSASCLMDAGIANVIGLNNSTDPWNADNCITHLYENLLKGLPVAQAVVETRKTLQKFTEDEFLNFPAIPFQKWSLLVHYELKPVSFFSSAQPGMEILKTQAYANRRSRLHGLLSEFLPPYAKPSGDSALLECLELCDESTGRIIQVYGDQGAGKTLLLHMLAFYLVGEERQAFYFDYADYYYTPANIEAMIAPVLAADANRPCIFLLDNFDPHYLSAKNLEDTEYSALERYIKKLEGAGHTVVLASLSVKPIFSPDFVRSVSQIAIRPLNCLEQRNLVSSLRCFNTTAQSPSLAALQVRCYGNPFLLKHIAPKMAAESDGQWFAELSRFLQPEQLHICVEQYYAWAWQQLTPVWRHWLMLLANLRGLVLEMLVVICDSKRHTQTVSQFLSIIGGSEQELSEGLAIMEEAGFILKYPIGSMIDPRCVRFIHAQSAQAEISLEDRQVLQDLLSRMICSSLILIIPEATRRSDQLLIQHLLSNRRQWAMHMENVWKSQAYEEFFDVLSVFSELLKKTGLSEELAQWSLHVMSEHPRSNFDENTPEFRAWLKLVALALATKQSLQNKAIEQTIFFCDRWLKSVSPEIVAGQPTLFSSIVQLLQTYYRDARQWKMLYAASETALYHYRQHAVWPLAVKAITSMIECCDENRDFENSLQLEHQLLNDIPLTDFPDGFLWQLKSRIIVTRITRKQLEPAQQLLNQLYAVSTELDRQGDKGLLLDATQADIHYQQDRLDAAALIYHNLIESLTDTPKSEQLSFFRQRYADIENRLGTENLRKIIQ